MKKHKNKGEGNWLVLGVVVLLFTSVAALTFLSKGSEAGISTKDVKALPAFAKTSKQVAAAYAVQNPGILSNAVGTVFMLRIMQQHSLFNEKWRLGFLFKYDLNNAFRAAVVLSIIIFVFTLIRF